LIQDLGLWSFLFAHVGSINRQLFLPISVFLTVHQLRVDPDKFAALGNILNGSYITKHISHPDISQREQSNS